MAEVNNDRLHIRLHVYDEEVEVTIRRSDEELYRRAAKLITDRYMPMLRLIRVVRASIQLR